jgi:hypothetical protein
MNVRNVRIVSQPKRLNIKLFEHQLASIYQMEKLEREQVVEREIPIGEHRSTTTQTETRLGINADPTGYGKTLSMIGMIARDKMNWDMDTPFTCEKITTESAGLVRSRVVTRYDRLPATLILVSPSILIQWERELSHTNLVVSSVVSKRDVDNIDASESDVVIVTLSMYNYLIRSYSRYAWKRFIFDLKLGSIGLLLQLLTQLLSNIGTVEEVLLRRLLEIIGVNLRSNLDILSYETMRIL